MRAAVWPILQFDSSNAPNIHFTLANKGVGPALIRNVVVKVDNQPVKNWDEAMKKLLGPGEHLFSESDMNGYVLAPNESITVVTLHDANNNPLVFDKSNPLWVTMNKDRFRVTAEICYCSTLGECWTPARWRIDTRHDHRDPSLPQSVGDYFPAVVVTELSRQVGCLGRKKARDEIYR